MLCDNIQILYVSCIANIKNAKNENNISCPCKRVGGQTEKHASHFGTNYGHIEVVINDICMSLIASKKALFEHTTI